MRGLTADEAFTLRDNLVQVHPKDTRNIDENPGELELHDRLEARGLLESYRAEWVEYTTDKDGVRWKDTWSCRMYRTTTLGRLALALHEMVVAA